MARGRDHAQNRSDGPTGQASGGRRRRARWTVFVACLATGVLTTSEAPTEPPVELTIVPAVQARLDVLARGLHHEIVLCLLGRTRGPTALVTELFMPVPHASTTTDVVTGPCPRRTVATWHNHPSSGGLAAPAVATDRSSRPMEAEGWGAAAGASTCRPSRRDVSTAIRLRIPFLVIADASGRHCIHPLARLEKLDG